MSSKKEIADKLKEGTATEAPAVVEAPQATTPISNPPRKRKLSDEQKADPVSAMIRQEDGEISPQIVDSNQMQFLPHWTFDAAHMERLALTTQAFWNSKYFNERFANMTQMFVVLLGGFDMGLSPMESINDTAMIKGKLTVHSKSKVKLVLRNPRYRASVSEWFGGEPQEMRKNKNKSTWDDGFGCRWRVWQKGIEEPLIGEWSVGDAKDTGNWGKATWASHPFHMLSTRAFDITTRIPFADSGQQFETTELAVELSRSQGTLTPYEEREEKAALAKAGE